MLGTLLASCEPPGKRTAPASLLSLHMLRSLPVILLSFGCLEHSFFLCLFLCLGCRDAVSGPQGHKHLSAKIELARHPFSTTANKASSVWGDDSRGTPRMHLQYPSILRRPEDSWNILRKFCKPQCSSMFAFSAVLRFRGEGSTMGHHTHRDRQTDRQTDRQPGSQADRQTDTHTHTQRNTHTHTYIHTHTHTHIHTYTPTHTHRNTHTHTHTCAPQILNPKP